MDWVMFILILLMGVVIGGLIQRAIYTWAATQPPERIRVVDNFIDRRKQVRDLVPDFRAGQDSVDDELDTLLNVKDDDPIIRGVLTLLEVQQQDHITAGSAPGVEASEAKAELRCVDALQGFEELLLKRMERARLVNR